jgi:2-dehydro-3-deoxyphosphogalactonate aldolase
MAIASAGDLMGSIMALKQRVFEQMPLIAILRGIEPTEVLQVAQILQETGFLCVEIPLNSPDPLVSIARLREHFDGELLIGAGTVLTPVQVEAVQSAGAQLVVSPNTNPAVIRATKSRGLLSIPGFATPTEAFAALEAGADALKLFPAELAPPSALKALKAVLSNDAVVFPVGGISPQSMGAYLAAGATGFGIGSALYTHGLHTDIIGARAAAFVKAWHDLGNRHA